MKESYHPYLFRLKEVDWSIFGTLTWRTNSHRIDTEKAEWFRKDSFRQLLIAVCTNYRIRGKDLAYYWAQECGTGECHYHFLIARNKQLERVNPKALAAFLQSRTGGLGRADIRPYDDAQGLAGVQYCLTREDGDPERIDGMSKGLKRLLNNQANGDSINIYPPRSHNFVTDTTSFSAKNAVV